METFVYGKHQYSYKLLRLDRKTFSLVVLPNLSIIVRSPFCAKQAEINKFLEKKWMWLEEQLKYFKKYQHKKTEKEYVSGESFLYLGRQYKLVVKVAKVNSVSLSKGVLICHTTDSVKNKLSTKDLLNSWYLEKAKLIFSERYEEVFRNFDYKEKPKLTIRKMNKRWGSFNRGKSITLNHLLIQASKDCIDYVITHELCHVGYRDHNKEFYKLLNMKFSGWEKVKEKLEVRLLLIKD